VDFAFEYIAWICYLLEKLFEKSLPA